MSNYLISWLAFNNDFYRHEGLEFNPHGPTGNVHRWHLDGFDKHIILLSWSQKPMSNEQEIKTGLFRKYIKDNHLEEKIDIRFLPINDVIDAGAIKQKLEPLISSLKGHTCEAFISPGTPTMQVVWYMLAPQYNIKLFQTRAPKDTDTPVEKIPVKIERDESNKALHIASYSDKTEEDDDLHMVDTKSLRPVYDKAIKVAETDRVIALITGETGTGKEHVAQTIHRKSLRRAKPFITVNCSAFRDDLLESRLFGYKKGAFTGAEKDTDGIFLSANGGTVFLDEIGDISPYIQQSLLRILQNSQIQPVGGNEPIQIDVRIITATHRDLKEMCVAGNFRWDLYYRLAVAEIHLPPLRKRGRKEVEDLLDHFIRVKRAYLDRSRLLRLTKEAQEYLLAYPYPGNIRELENLIETLYVFAPKDWIIEIEDLPGRIRDRNAPLSWSLEDAKGEHIKKAMEYFQDNKLQAAKALGISPNTLRKYL